MIFKFLTRKNVILKHHMCTWHPIVIILSSVTFNLDGGAEWAHRVSNHGVLQSLFIRHRTNVNEHSFYSVRVTHHVQRISLPHTLYLLFFNKMILYTAVDARLHVTVYISKGRDSLMKNVFKVCFCFFGLKNITSWKPFLNRRHEGGQTNTHRVLYIYKEI